MQIDWSPVTQAVVALIATLITTFIPLLIKMIFEAQAARLAKVKMLTEQNQAVVTAIVQVVQQTAGVLEGSQKYQLALGKASEALKLPTNTLHDMIELAVSTAKLSWGTAWDALGGSKTPTE